MRYIVPDYYSRFSCKGPACRKTCCKGFFVTVTLSEYYRLSGLQCSKSIRRRLDSALKVLERPTPERYALLSPDDDGKCPLLTAEGYCALQKSCGETALSSVCRYFPRSPRMDHLPECACSNGCEAVLELLFREEAPMQFSERELDFALPDSASVKNIKMNPNYVEIRRYVIQRMQRRDEPIPTRILAVGDALAALGKLNLASDQEGVLRCLADLRERRPVTDIPEKTLPALNALLRLVAWCAGESRTLFPYAEELFSRFGLSIREPVPEALSPEALTTLNALEDAFLAAVPDAERCFEQMLVNHIFYESFPFSDRHESIADEYLSLTAIHGVVKLLCIGHWAADNPTQGFVDAATAAFRYIAHTSFDRNSVVLLHEWSFYAPEQIRELAAL